MDRLKNIVRARTPLKRAEMLLAFVNAEDYKEAALIPAEESMQIPEALLSTKVLPECETYFLQDSREITLEEAGEWNSRVDSALEVLDIDLDAEDLEDSQPREEAGGLEKRVREVFGAEEAQ